MPMYALSVVPLINALTDDCIKQVWYADNATACGQLIDVRWWWDTLVSIGPNFGYYPNSFDCEKLFMIPQYLFFRILVFVFCLG